MVDTTIVDFIGFSLPENDAVERARNAALATAASVSTKPTSLVSFDSGGNVLIIGPEPYALSMAESIEPSLHCSILATERGRSSGGGSALPRGETARSCPTAHATLHDLHGYLGHFSATVTAGEKIIDLAEFFGASEHFDIVLDLGRNPAIRRELMPPGYFAPGSDESALHRALEEINGLLGEFEKPVYTIYNPDICAHGARGLTGCTRCLDACPADAIQTVKEVISVNPHLCHGAGACATACPSGAIGYAYPRSIDTLEQLRQLLAKWHGALDSAPCVLFFDRETCAARLSGIGDELPRHAVPFPVESVGAIGLETWLYCLSHGAGSVVLLAQAAGRSAVSVLESQVGCAHALLAPLEMEARLVLLVESEGALIDSIPGPDPLPDFKPATFAAMDDKRTVVKLALDHLCEYGSLQDRVLALPVGAPFGEIRVDRDACTLCLACTAVCTMSALTDGVDLPQLNFAEWNCVQCGLCKTACPEDAISLSARYVFDPEARRSSRVLHEEPPFRCIACDSPFASRGMIDKMLEKLSDHHMFQGEALNRLKMCEDCRVKDMF